MSPPLVLLVAVMVIVGGCSDEGEQVTQLTAPSITTSQTSTTPVTTPTTEQSTTPTVDEAAAAEEAAVQALMDGLVAWRSCLADLELCDPAEALAGTHDGEYLANLVEVVDGWKSNGWRVREPDDPNHGTRTIIAVEVQGSELQEVVVEFCEVDAGIIYEPGAGPGGEDVVVDDSAASRLAQGQLNRSADGAWRLVDAEVLEAWVGANGCTDDA